MFLRPFHAVKSAADQTHSANRVAPVAWTGRLPRCPGPRQVPRGMADRPKATGCAAPGRL